jgi:hypothetical protein
MADKGLRAAIAKMFTGLLTKDEYSKSAHNKGHYFEGDIGRKYACRSSQSKRRKLERRVGHI